MDFVAGVNRAMNWMTHLSVKAKMGLVMALFAVVVIFFANVVFTEWNQQKTFSLKERYGTEFYAPAFALLKAAQRHRGNGIQVAQGVTEARQPLQQAAASVEQAFAALAALEQQYSDSVPMGERLQQLRVRWDQVRQTPATLPPAEGFAAHSDFIEQIMSYIEFFSDQSNLTLDPEVDSFYLMQLISFTLPRAIEYSAQMRGVAAAAVAEQPTLTGVRNRLLALKPLAVDKVEEALRSAQKASASVEGALDGDIKEIRDANQRFMAEVQQVIETGRSALNSRTMFALGTEVVDAGFGLQLDVVPALQGLLEQRLDNLRAEQRNTAILLAVITALALLVTVLVVRGLLQGMQQTTGYLAEIKRGNLDNQIDIRGSDEIAKLMEGVESLQATLKETRDRERQAAEEMAATAAEAKVTAEENKRVADALMACDTSVMIADESNNIIFLNQAVQRMLKRRQETLESELPSFKLDQLMGTNMDVFHQNPAHQRKLVSELQEVYRARIKIENLTFNLTATPLFNSAGERSGTIVEWEDLTDRLAQEEQQLAVAQENQRVRIALDNSSTNTMIADSDNRIVYVNQALTAMMSNAESDVRKDLPNFKADKLVGANMDVFHKNPGHQQRMIRELKSRHETQINVGGRHFRLIANPVLDANGERLGTVVEWLDRTQEVLIENEVNEIVEAAAQGDFSRSLNLDGKFGFYANLASGLNQVMATTNDGLHDIARVMSALARGDLTQTITAEYQGLFKRLQEDVNATVSKLESVIANIIESSASVTTGANEIAQGNSDLSQRTEEQASSLEETASSMEQMTGAVQQTSDNAQHANQLSKNAVDTAEAGGNVVKRAVVAMEDINSASKRIADIIGVIDEIAFQTNLLALNAAVEAARAGEQGRGFAVVAGEVRNLAQRSAGAAKEIKDLIRDSVNKVEAGTELVNQSGTTLAEIVQAVRDVTNMISDISTAAQEQSSSIVQINQAISEMDEMTQQNAALVEQASAAGETMAEQARSLMDLVGFFTLDHSASVALGQTAVAPPATARAAASKPAAPAAKLRSPLAPAPSASVDDEWEEF